MNYFPVSSKQRKRQVSSSLAASYCFFLIFKCVSSSLFGHFPLASIVLIRNLGHFFRHRTSHPIGWRILPVIRQRQEKMTNTTLYTTRKANQLLSMLQGSRQPESRGVGNVSICPNFARTAAVDVLFSINFAVVFDFIYFRFRPSKAK
jgi:hypothetical protein